MARIDYLYVDDSTLDQYVEQIASPVTYDKVSVWKAGMSITGPEAGATQQRHGRTRTRHE